MRKRFLVPFLALSACAAAVADDALLAELRASRATPLAVPAVDDVKLTMHMSMGAVLWAQLDDATLLDWAHGWQAARGAEDRPVCRFESHEGGAIRTGNWFDTSAKSGFCLVFAMAAMDMPIANQPLRAAWRRLQTSMPNR